MGKAFASMKPAWKQDLVVAARTFLPVLETAYHYGSRAMEAARPYHPEHLAMIAMGLVMLYGGGKYMALIAAAEAYRLSAWGETKKLLAVLKKNMDMADEALRKDAQVDEDKDGIADIKQMTAHDAVERQIKVFMGAIEPVQVTHALGQLYVGFVAVVATLKMHFAQAIALGAALGEMLFQASHPFLRPIIKASLPEQYQKWAPVALGYMCKSIGILFAWSLQRALSAFHSSLRGVQFLGYGISELMKASAVFNGDINTLVSGNDMLLHIYGFVIAMTGFWYQITHRFQLPLVVNTLMVPATMLEYALVWIISK